MKSLPWANYEFYAFTNNQTPSILNYIHLLYQVYCKIIDGQQINACVCVCWRVLFIFYFVCLFFLPTTVSDTKWMNEWNDDNTQFIYCKSWAFT